MPAITSAERNRRKRERKKQQKEEERRRREEEEEKLKKEKEADKKEEETKVDEEDVEVEYVTETLSVENQAMEDIIQRFQMRGGGVLGIESSSVVVSDEDEEKKEQSEDEEEEPIKLSKRKQKEAKRPTVAELKQRVQRADLVEAHDVTAPNPEFLIYMKSIPNTVAVPRHWGRKRKYLQGKRGIEKAPFALPDFILRTGITEIRSALAEDEAKMTTKQKNRMRVAPKMSGADVDYRTLHDAFFKYQTIPSLTKFGDLYYEGKEYETHNKPLKDMQPGIISDRLREALGMTDSTSPPPWLTNMQRYGPPPSYPTLKIPGLNAPLPPGATYGFHMNGWGKPPLDEFGRPLYGGDPFAEPQPVPTPAESDPDALLVTSDGKALGSDAWGALPTLTLEQLQEEQLLEEGDMEEESSEEEYSEEEGEELERHPEEAREMEPPADGVDSVLPSSALDLRKTSVEEDDASKVLYTVLEQKPATEDQTGQVFKSDVEYVLPKEEGGEKDVLGDVSVKKRRLDDEDEGDDLGKKFKF